MTHELAKMNGKHFLLMAMVVFLGIGPSSAQNKVVVIPLMEKGCLAPVAVDSPSNWVYSNNGDSTVTDKVTGLVWQREDDNTQRKWNDAWNYCNGNECNDHEGHQESRRVTRNSVAAGWSQTVAGAHDTC